MAFSLSATGAGLGVLIFPNIINSLEIHYGWQGAFIITAGELIVTSSYY